MRHFLMGLVFLFASANAIQAAPTEDPYAEVNASWERFGAVYSRILENYYARLDQGEVMSAAIKGMLGQLDPYSEYYDEEGLRQLRQDTTGKFAGLGITVAIKDRFPVVISPIEDTPAFRAGLRPGDLIVAVEGKSTLDMQLESVVNALRGEPGTKVAISVAPHLGATPREVEIQREIITIKSVVLVEELQEKIGYISMRQTRFSEHTSSEVEEAIKSLPRVEGLILDLRGNPGGLFSQATQVADLFLPQGVPIVSIRERDGRREEVKYSHRHSIARNVPLVVLIDEGSASASEIVAGAIQDNDRGVVVGAASFGKGSVQTIFDLREREEEASALKLTTALYYAPSGRSIHREQDIAKPVHSVLFGDRELPHQLVMDLILRSENRAKALSALQSHFDMDSESAESLLLIRLGDLVGKSKMRAAGSPDSMGNQTYYTQRGRRVFGGGGIKPDISIESEPFPPYVQELVRRRLFFDFVIDYVSTDSSWVEEHPNLTVSDEMVDGFMEFVRTKDISIDQGQKGLNQIEELEDLAAEMDWGIAAQEPIQQLRAAVKQEWERRYSRELEPYIKSALRRELILRFRGRKAQLIEELQEDVQLAKAIEVLADQDQYLEVLAAEETK
ncbi:MAG: S41 family peptidase [Gemmatimonadetes bacterium]|nr:S41 family peptidase [Gemmatimonadota bacterium]MYC73864.1 S41 family peptidase [Gemmatimonadota bacterium]